MNLVSVFTNLANVVARATGRPATFVSCIVLVLVWAASGPVFHFSDTWQLVINTGTTIVTFLMVFLIQNTQNRESAAMQAKLNELLHAVEKADVRFIGIEHLTDRQLDMIIDECERRAGPAAEALPIARRGKRLTRTPSEHAEPAGAVEHEADALEDLLPKAPRPKRKPAARSRAKPKAKRAAA